MFVNRITEIIFGIIRVSTTRTIDVGNECPDIIPRHEASESELGSCVKVEVDVLGSPSLIVLNMVSVDGKQH